MGDEVIRMVALKASEQLQRPSDEAFRYGGEEFTLLLPNTDIAGAMALAEKVRLEIAAIKVVTDKGPLSCTVSLGVSSTDKHKVNSVSELVEIADKGLYLSKQNGRNQINIVKPELN